MTEYWINVWTTPDDNAYFVEAFADGESLGRVISDDSEEIDAVDAYLAPYDLERTYDSPIRLYDLPGGWQFRVVELGDDED